MSPPAAAKARRLWVRLARIQIALWIMCAGRALDALGARLLPADLRHGRAHRDKDGEN